MNRKEQPLKRKYQLWKILLISKLNTGDLPKSDLSCSKNSSQKTWCSVKYLHREKKEYSNSPNEGIKEFIELLSNFSETSDLNTNLKVFSIAQSLRNNTDYSSLYYDDNHLDFNSEIPFVKSLLLSSLLITSKGIPVDQKQVSLQKY